MRKTAVLAALAGIAAAFAARRRRQAAKARADLYFDDGSMVSLAEGDAEADRLLGAARAVLSAARGTTASNAPTG